jgi:hypothetical protein
MEASTSQVLGLIIWSRYRVDFLRSALEGKTFTFGILPLENIIVHRLGSRFGPNCQRLIGISLSCLSWLFLNMHSFFSWCLRMLLPLRKRCVVGALQVLPFANSALLVKKESREHLFFSCSFSRIIWRSALADCLIIDPPVDWDSLCQWCVDHPKGSSLFATIYKLCLGSAVYHLWRHRNDLE